MDGVEGGRTFGREDGRNVRRGLNTETSQERPYNEGKERLTGLGPVGPFRSNLQTRRTPSQETKGRYRMIEKTQTVG